MVAFGAFGAFEMRLKVMFQLLDDGRYGLRVLQTLKKLMALAGAETIDGGRQLVEIILFHRGHPAIAGGLEA